MPAHHDKHHAHHTGARPFPPGPMHRFFGAEESASLTDVAEILAGFAESLAKSGQVKLRDGLEVSPPDPCETLVHYEQTPKGHLVLRIELKWGSDESGHANGDSLADLKDGSATIVGGSNGIPVEERL